jgi:glutamyl aminopeptidase
MDTWTRQKGYPVLTLTKTGGSYTITQQRFLTDPNAYNQTDEVSPFNYKWEVPVTFVSSVSQNPTQVWFHLEDNSISM